MTSSASDHANSSPTPFADLDAYLALPRMSGLLLSPAGDRLVTSVATLGPDRTEYVSALWEVDPAGGRPARRLTRSVKGETPAAFLPDGGLLFTSSRPDPQAKPDDEPPADGGEARVVAVRPGGVQAAVAGMAGAGAAALRAQALAVAAVVRGASRNAPR